MSGSSPYFDSTKPSFFSQMRKRTFNESKKNEQPASTSSGTPSSHSSGLGNLEPSSHVSKTPSSGLGNTIPSHSGPKGSSSGLGNIEPSPYSSKYPSSGLGGLTPSTSNSKSSVAGLGNMEPSPCIPSSGFGNLVPSPSDSKTDTSPRFELSNLAQVKLIPDTEAMPLPGATPSPVPVAKPRTIKTTPVPKQRPRSFNGEDTCVDIKSDNVKTPPIPTSRKNKPVSPVTKPVTQPVKPVPRERIYSKDTKEYKQQRKESVNKPTEIQSQLKISSAATKNSPTVLFPPTNLHYALEDEHSLINILDLEIQSSIRSQYLKAADLESEDEEPDSDEDTNQQIELLKKLVQKDGCNNDDNTTLTNTTQKSTGDNTLKATPLNKSPPPPQKPPRSRSRSPGVKQKNKEKRDPTAPLCRSETYTNCVEEKDKKKSWKLSPFAKRKNKKPEPVWELPKESVTKEFDSESIMSESSALNPVEFPLHKTKQVGDLQLIIAKNPLIDVNKRDVNYNTPLHYILKKKRPKRCGLIMAILQTGRVDVNAQDIDDNTPLHIAAEMDYYKCVAVLLAFNANPFIKNKQLRHPLELARHSSPLHALLSKQFHPLVDNDPITLSSLPEATTPVDPQELANERIGRLLMPDKINCFVRKIDAEVKAMERGSFLDSYEAQPMSLRELTDSEKDVRKCLDDQKFYLNRWKQTSGSRVLFLDGGGIRGLIQIEILMELEKRTGRRITELFDWIIGTSTGGIVALGLVYGGKTLQQMRQLYFKIKNEVFGGNIAGTFMKMPQKSKKFEQILKKEFGEDMLMSSVTHPRVMICTVNKAHLPLRVIFFNNFMEDNPELKEIPVWKAARASSAAPMYFTEFEGKYVDGGVKANNPCEFAMTQINQYDEKMGLPARHFAMAVSIGTGIFPNRNLGDGDGKDFGIFNLRKQMKYVKDLTELFTEAVADSEMTAEKFAVWCQQWKDPIPFFRLNPSLQNVMSPGEVDDEKLIDMLLDTKLYLAKTETLQTFANIVRVFKRLQSDK